MRLIQTLVLLSCSFHVQAFDISNTGEYAVVHVDGHLTDKVFRVLQKDGRWAVEDKKAEGSWEDVTCEDECKLVVSSPQQVEILVGNNAPTPVCQPDPIQSLHGIT